MGRVLQMRDGGMDRWWPCSCSNTGDVFEAGTGLGVESRVTIVLPTSSVGGRPPGGPQPCTFLSSLSVSKIQECNDQHHFFPFGIVLVKACRVRSWVYKRRTSLSERCIWGISRRRTSRLLSRWKSYLTIKTQRSYFYIYYHMPESGCKLKFS